MLRLAIKIWFKGVVVFSIVCAILTIPTLGLALFALAFGLLISLLAIPFYIFIVYILKRSEATYSNAVFFLFVATIPAILIALLPTILIDNSNPLDFQINAFYTNPAFCVPWLCAAIGILLSRKYIKQFFDEPLNEPINQKNIHYDLS